jgi:hypothetical protein
MTPNPTVARLDADLAATPDPAITCVLWPSDADRRADLARAGVPRLLLVEPGQIPPDEWARDEDWVRVPATVEEVTLRADTLRRRLASTAPPGG